MINLGVTLGGRPCRSRSSILSTAGRGRLFDSIIRYGRRYADHPHQQSRPRWPDDLRQSRSSSIHPGGFGQGTDLPSTSLRKASAAAHSSPPRPLSRRQAAIRRGIGLAMVCAQRAIRWWLTMADNFSVERRKLMCMIGAEVVLTPRALKGFGMYRKAIGLAGRRTAGSSPTSSRRRRTPTFTRRRRRARLSAISPANASMSLSPATAPGAP